MTMLQHTTVLLEEAVEALLPRPNLAYVDATLGGGGHARRLCEHLDRSNALVGIDQDPVALEKARASLAGCGTDVILKQGNFRNLHSLLIEAGFPKIDGGILMDLGVSDFQLGEAARGFSFSQEAPLDMRMSPEMHQTAAELVNTMDPKSLANLFYKYADEKLSRQIASAIANARPITTTRQLAQIAEGIYRQKGVKAQNIHPATRIFQALRIAVNQEMEALESVLEQLPSILLPGARVAIITFHSLEDRMVKQYFREASAVCLCPPRQPLCTCQHQPTFSLVGKPIFPSDAELQASPKSRSAKLRIAERI